MAYTFSVVNSGNVKLRGLQFLVPLLAGNSSDGSITCAESTSSNIWSPGTDLASGASLSCSGSYVFNQAAIEAGDISPVVTATASNLAAAVIVAVPTIAVPSMPQLQVAVDTTGCTLPQSAGESDSHSAMHQMRTNPAVIACLLRSSCIVCYEQQRSKMSFVWHSSMCRT